MIRIRTLGINVDSLRYDNGYKAFRERRILRAGENENELACYDLDQTESFGRSELDIRFPGLNDYEIDKRLAPQRSIKAIEEYDPKIIVMGQTKITENFAIALKNKDFLIIRYSSFYGISDKGHAYTFRGEQIKTGSQYAVHMEDAGYSLSSPKKPEFIIEFLQDEKVVDSVARQNKKDLVNAIESFNKGKEKPILITSFFERLWD